MSSSILPTYARHEIAFERGKDAHLFSTDGEAYLDFGAGIAVNALGHCHPHLVETLKEQTEKLWHTSNLFVISDGEKLAQRLCAATFADKVFFTNSGAEALECAIKMARKYHAAKDTPEKFRLITFEGAFHGRTLATIAAGGQAKHLDGFGPKVDGFDQVPFSDLAAVKATIGEATAGILIEPVQGEGGIRPVPREMLIALREICDQHDILLIFDEVQSGIGRTGRLFAHEWAGVTPDIMAVAKGIGGGFPMGACLAREQAASGMVAGSHGSTFGGNPLAMAVGNAVLDVVLEDGFLQAVRDKSIVLSQKLAHLCDEYPDIIETARGLGLMIGIKCKIANTKLAAACLDHKLITVGAGENVLRLLPPLTITAQDIDDAVTALAAACQSLREASS